MKDFTAVIFGLGAGLAVFCISETIITFGNPTKEQIGYTYSELQQMKRKCEEDLPRNKQCVIIVQYLPQQEGK